jgi:hypothetical protein
MNDWKKVLMFGAFGAAAYLMISGKRNAGFAAVGVGLAALAAEHPERFEEIWNQAPDYLERGHRIVNGVQTLLDRIAEHTQTIQSLRGNRQEYRASSR